MGCRRRGRCVHACARLAAPKCAAMACRLCRPRKEVLNCPVKPGMSCRAALQQQKTHIMPDAHFDDTRLAMRDR